jgi:LmbE family N-acetylglucosaminyl deacetylase
MDGWSVLIGVLGALAAIGSTVVLFLKSRGENRHNTTNAKTALDARIDERIGQQLNIAWKRIDEVEAAFKALETREQRRTGAITRILRAIYQQWPIEAGGPNLDPADISEIEETIPPSWIKNHPGL